MTLTEFLLARIEEDEEDARDALERGFGGWEWLADAGINFEARTHIVRWHPARVLAECDIKRAFVYYERFGWLAGCEPKDFIYSPEQLGRMLLDADTKAIRFLALPYADHPDYHEEWRP